MKVFYNEKDESGKRREVTLNAMEQHLADRLQKEYEAIHAPRLTNAWRNALQSTSGIGFERLITTLTTVVKKITEQKFFEIAPADYVPVKIGDGAFNTNLLTYRSYDLAGDFGQGVINIGTDNTRLASADAGVDSLSIPINSWAKSISWNIILLEEAARSGNWDIVAAKEKARKRNWDLGIQRTAFLGLSGSNVVGQVYGLLTQPSIAVSGAQYAPAPSLVSNNSNSFLTTSIYKLATTPSNLTAFIGGLLNLYRVNCGSSAWPTHLEVPESDFLGMATPSSATFPIKSILELMQETFQTMTNNKNFKILPCRYADSLVINSGSPVQQYCLYNYAEESLRMDIPVDYTNTLANSLNNFSFQNAAYGQFTGVLAYRPQEMYYLSFPSSQA